MTPQELQDFVVSPIRADIQSGRAEIQAFKSEIHRRIDKVEAKTDANTKFRYKVYGWMAALSLVSTIAGKYLF